jgi:hypothetical protein
MKSVKPTATPAELDAGWSVAGLVFDHAKKSVTACLNGVAVYSRALSGPEMAQLARIGRSAESPVLTHPDATP